MKEMSHFEDLKLLHFESIIPRNNNLFFIVLNTSTSMISNVLIYL